jgi:DnaK suppressor protein
VEADRLRGLIGALRADGSGGELAVLDDEVAPPEDIAEALTTREQYTALVADAAQALKGIEAAEALIKEGSYGRCADCDQPISIARMEAVPAAQRCITCQERRERTHRMR